MVDTDCISGRSGYGTIRTCSFRGEVSCVGGASGWNTRSGFGVAGTACFTQRARRADGGDDRRDAGCRWRDMVGR